MFSNEIATIMKDAVILENDLKKRELTIVFPCAVKKYKLCSRHRGFFYSMT
jgi:hypothetical protein